MDILRIVNWYSKDIGRKVCCQNRIRHRCGILGQCPHVQCMCVTREHSSQVLCNQIDFPVKIEHFRFPGSPRNIFYFWGVAVSPWVRWHRLRSHLLNIMSHMRHKTRTKSTASTAQRWATKWAVDVSRCHPVDVCSTAREKWSALQTISAQTAGWTDFVTKWRKRARSALVTRKIYLNVTRLIFRNVAKALRSRHLHSISNWNGSEFF